MYDADSELKGRLIELFGPGPAQVTVDEAMTKAPRRQIVHFRGSSRGFRASRRLALLWLGAIVVLIAALVVGFGTGLGSEHHSTSPTGPTSSVSWHQITFGGLRLSVPSTWPVRQENVWPDCKTAASLDFESSAVVLNTGSRLEGSNCAKPSPAASLGILVDSGPYGPLEGGGVGACRDQNGLRICASNSSAMIGIYAVHIAGSSRAVALEIGLGGNGRIARTVLDSLAPSQSPTTTTSSTTTTTTTIGATTTTTATTQRQTLPPLSLASLPVPTDYTCATGLYPLSSANEATSECVPYAYLVGGTATDPSNDTACPAGSTMTMGPVECDNDTGIVSAVPAGPNTCSTPGGPCPSSNLPLSAQASVIPWSEIEFPTGKCSAGYYFGETDGVATCVPYAYLPGGTSSSPNNNSACPPGSALKAVKLTGTLCTQDAEPYDIVAPIPRQS